jgi:biotin transporter BioY
MAGPVFRPSSAVWRALIGVGGGFMLACTLAAALAGWWMHALAMARADALIAAGMLALLAWPACTVAAFLARSAARAAAWLLGPALVLAAAGWLAWRAA